jgi:hypothetical protein
MTPLQVKGELLAFQGVMGPKAEIFASIDLRYSKTISISGYPQGICKSCAFRIEADDWPEAIDLAKAEWAKSAERFQLRMVAEMALEIIKVTADLGQCTDAALCGEKWTREDVARYGAEACVKANEMAANGPFSIAPADKANAL